MVWILVIFFVQKFFLEQSFNLLGGGAVFFLDNLDQQFTSRHFVKI
jgi:hypothetical protein